MDGSVVLFGNRIKPRSLSTCQLMPEIAMFTAMAAASTVSANGNGAKIRVNMLATVSPHNAATPVMEFQCIP